MTFLVFLHFLTGCSLAPRLLYKIDVQQGNVLTDEMFEKLRPGMTRSQVRFVLGSPLIVDPFRNNRWDYAYIQRIRGGLVEQKKLTIYFEDDRLVRTEMQEMYSSGRKTPQADAQPQLKSDNNKLLPDPPENSVLPDAESGKSDSTSKNPVDDY